MRPCTSTSPAALQGAVGHVARQPAALHEHGAAVRQAQRRQRVEAGAAVHRAVVQVDGGRRHPVAAQHQGAVLLRGGDGRITHRIGQRQRRQRTLALHGVVQRDLLRRAVQLPEAEAAGHQHTHDGGQQDDGARPVQHVRPGPRR
jgi:hypothetical protein